MPEGDPGGGSLVRFKSWPPDRILPWAEAVIGNNRLAANKAWMKNDVVAFTAILLNFPSFAGLLWRLSHYAIMR